MALTRIGSVGLSTGININAGVGTFTGNLTVGGVLTYEDVTNVDSIGIITARAGVKVGSGITLSSDGDIFFTGIMTGNGSGLTGVANTDVIFTDKLGLGDDERISLGIGSDLQLYHNSSNNNSFIDNSTGDLNIRGGGGDILINPVNNETAIYAIANGKVQLRWNNITKLETATTGINPSADSTDDLGTDTVRWRNIYGDTLYGDGSNLTGIEAGITTEAASISGITTYLNLSKDDHELVVTGTNTISVIGGAQGTSHTLRLQNSGIATVTLDSTYFKFPSGAAAALPTADGSISLVSFTVHKAGAVGVNTVLLTGASVNFS